MLHLLVELSECNIVFVAVPTPTTPKGFDSSIVEDALKFVPDGVITVIKSTVLLGTTKNLQRLYPNLTILISPEFLSETTAAHDATNPFSNIVGMPENSKQHQKAAELVQRILPKAPFTLTCDSDEAEIIKYTHNGSGYVQIVFFNMIYDLAKKMGHDWSNIGEAIKADPMISNRYSNPVHKSGRGAGGHCFIKDIAALRELYSRTIPEDKIGLDILSTLEKKNISLLVESGKDLDLLKEVYGNEIIDK